MAEAGTVELDLPYPPSVNRYWRHNRGRTHLSKDGRAYQKSVEVRAREARGLPLTENVRVVIALHPPDRRRRDLDNALKAILDALQHGGVLEDDCQVKILEALMLSPVSGGACSVKVETIRE